MRRIVRYELSSPSLLSGKGLFPRLETAGVALVAAAFLAVSVVSSYVGSRRGESLYAYNNKISRRGGPR